MKNCNPLQLQLQVNFTALNYYYRAGIAGSNAAATINTVSCGLSVSLFGANPSGKTKSGITKRLDGAPAPTSDEDEENS